MESKDEEVGKEKLYAFIDKWGRLYKFIREYKAPVCQRKRSKRVQASLEIIFSGYCIAFFF